MIISRGREQWNNFAAAINKLGRRERVLVTVSLMALVYLAGDFLLLQPLSHRKADLQENYEVLSRELEKASKQETLFANAIKNDPGIAKKREVERLTKRVEKLDENLTSSYSLGILPAEKLPQVLRDTIVAKGDLQLIGLKAESPLKVEYHKEKEASIQEGKSHKVKSELDKVALYKHGVVLEFVGDFFSILNYLITLEKLEWKFYWDSLDYHVESYPNVRVKLSVYTLSTAEGIWK